LGLTGVLNPIGRNVFTFSILVVKTRRFAVIFLLTGIFVPRSIAAMDPVFLYNGAAAGLVFPYSGAVAGLVFPFSNSIAAGLLFPYSGTAAGPVFPYCGALEAPVFVLNITFAGVFGNTAADLIIICSGIAIGFLYFGLFVYTPGDLFRLIWGLFNCCSRLYSK